MISTDLRDHRVRARKNVSQSSRKYRINPKGRGIYPTYLIVKEVSKTIEIINSRMYLYKALARGLYTDTSLNL